MKCSFGISDFLEDISSLSHSVVFLYLFALITEEGFLMTNQDSVLKSRDITLPTKVCLFKAMVFPVVTYGCESWTVKKAER